MSTSSTASVQTRRTSVPAGLRLLVPGSVPDLAAHLDRYGPLRPPFDLVAEVDAAGLRGRGGAGFPTAVKMRAVRDGTRRGLFRKPAVVVANGTEGEPASNKDKALLTLAPHLVFDGMVAAALAVGAERAVLCIERRYRRALAPAYHALQERGRHGDPVVVEIAETPSGYVTGEETALVSWLNGGVAVPTFAPPRPSDKGVGGNPTLVDNVETLAHLGWIARFGADSFRQVGEANEPGTLLVTVSGAVAVPSVQEIEIGAPLAPILERVGAQAGSAVLVGGYFGTWMTADQAQSAIMSTAGLKPLGASLGCGLIAVLPETRVGGHCPLQEVSTVMRWLAGNSAGQCGPCVNGLPALASTFASVVAGDRDGRGDALLDRWAPMVAGRGACKLPDGAVHFLNSARRVFDSHIRDHRRYGPCPPNKGLWLPTPDLPELR